MSNSVKENMTKRTSVKGTGFFMSMLGLSILILTITFSFMLVSTPTADEKQTDKFEKDERVKNKDSKKGGDGQKNKEYDKKSEEKSDSKKDKKRSNNKKLEDKSESGKNRKSRVSFGREHSGPPYVKVLPVKPDLNVIVFEATGRLAIKSLRVLNAKVAGEVMMLHPNLEAGAQIKKGEIVAKIDPVTLSRQLTATKARLTQAQSNLTQEEARAKQAKRDLKKSGIKNPSALALRQPQLRSVGASITAITAEIKDFQSDMTKVNVVNPINGIVLDKKAQLGNQVGKNMPIATLIDMDMLTVAMPLTKKELMWLGTDSIKMHKKVDVRLDGEPQHKWTAILDRLSPEVDVKTQSLTVFANLPFPYEKVAIEDTLLRVGSAVNVTLSGRGLPNSQWINTAAIEEGQYIWVVDSDSKLQREKVIIVKTREAKGLNDSKQSLVVFSSMVTNYVPKPQGSFTIELEVSTTLKTKLEKSGDADKEKTSKKSSITDKKKAE